MKDRTFVVRFKPPETSTQRVIAATADAAGDYLVLLKANGELAGLFSMEVVESWVSD